MILDITKLHKSYLGTTLVYTYPLTFNDNERFATIKVEGIGSDRQIEVYLSENNVLTGADNKSAIVGELFETNDIKIAWEKFEDLFSQSDEGKSQQSQEPEVTRLFLTFNATGEAKLFLQNEDGDQQVVLDFVIDDMEFRKFPKAYTLDYTDDTNMPEQ